MGDWYTFIFLSGENEHIAGKATGDVLLAEAGVPYDMTFQLADVFVRGVGQPNGVAGAGLHVDLRAEFAQSWCDHRHERHAALVCLSLFENRDVDEHYPSRMTLSAPVVAADAKVSYAEIMSVSLK